MSIGLKQGINTRNQSTLDYTLRRVFIFNNRFEQATITNATAVNLQSGMLVTRSATVAGGIELLTDIANIDKVIGILNVDPYIDNVPLKAGDTMGVTYCVSGSVDGTKLVSSANVALDLTVVTDGKSTLDYINALGIYTDITAVEHTTL